MLHSLARESKPSPPDLEQVLAGLQAVKVSCRSDGHWRGHPTEERFPQSTTSAARSRIWEWVPSLSALGVVDL